MTALPSLDKIREWCGVSATSLPDDQLQVIYDGEAANQFRVCRTPDPLDVTQRTDDQIAAIYRRCGRAVAAKGLPLGATPGNDEYGPTALARWDSEIERYEGPTRKFVFG